MMDAVYTVFLQRRSIHQAFGVYIGKDVPSGLYVVSIEPNSPAAETKIQPGDRVVAINEHLVSSMRQNSEDLIVQMLSNAGSVTLSLQPSDTLKLLGISSTNYQHHGQDKTVNYDLDNYVKSILNGGTYILHSLPSNQNEFISTSGTYGLRSRPRPHRRDHHHRKRTALKSVETQTSRPYERRESMPRSVPNMGTAHFSLRNTQSIPTNSGPTKGSEGNFAPTQFLPIENHSSSTKPTVQPIPQPTNNAEWSHYSPKFIFPPTQPAPVSQQLPNARPIPEIASTSSSSPGSHDHGIHAVNLRRVPTFPGYGFHLQYNRVYYIIIEIEPHSPAEFSGLRVSDIILRVNNQPTDQMIHRTFMKLINDSSQLVFLVQPYGEFIRTNPNALRPAQPNTIVNIKKDNQSHKTPMSRVISRFRSR